MRRHIVRPGDCIVSLAARGGCSVEDIWDHPDNRELRELRGDPALLKQGDVVMVPERERLSHSVSPQSTQNFSAAQAQTTLRLKLVAPPADDSTVATTVREEGDTITYTEPDIPRPPEDEPMAGVAYRLEVGGRVYEGETGSDGVIEQQVSASATTGKLVIEPGTRHEISSRVLIGHLDPFGEDSGIRQRLNNLGIFVERDSDDEDKALAVALSVFQHKHGLEISGTLDDATRDALRDKHGI